MTSSDTDITTQESQEPGDDFPSYRVGDVLYLRDFLDLPDDARCFWRQVAGPIIAVEAVDQLAAKFTVPAYASGKVLLFEVEVCIGDERNTHSVTIPIPVDDCVGQGSYDEFLPDVDESLLGALEALELKRLEEEGALETERMLTQELELDESGHLKAVSGPETPDFQLCYEERQLVELQLFSPVSPESVSPEPVSQKSPETQRSGDALLSSSDRPPRRSWIRCILSRLWSREERSADS